MKHRVKKNGQKRVKRGQNLDLLTSDFDGNMCKIFDISLFSGDRRRVLSILEQKIDLGTKKYWVATVNPEFVMSATKDKDFKQILNKTNLNVVDGIGLVWARELGRRLSIVDRRNLIKKIIVGFNVGVEVLKGGYRNQISSGADLILELAKIAKEKNKKIFLLGGWNGRAEKTANFLVTKNLDRRLLIVDPPAGRAGCRNELQIDWSEGEPKISNTEVVEKINKFKPDILLVAYGMKRQEFWIDKNLKNLDVGLVMGVGRSFDYYSGELKRAPNWVRKIGMEWFYSLVKEPKRFKRQLALPKFVWKVLSSRC